MHKITLEQEKNVKLYYQKDLSAPAIATALNLSLSQVYDSLKKQNVRRRTAAQQNKIRFIGSPLSFKFREQLSSKENDLMIAALMLYMGEGAKTGNTVDLVNSDVLVLKLFIKFLRNICGINEAKIRIYLYCFEGQDIDAIINFWAKELKVYKGNFTKPYIRKNVGEKSRNMANGVVHIRYNDKRLLEKILYLCDELMHKLLS